MLTEGRSKRGTVLSIKYITTAAPLRAAVIISKSVAKKAVERNRLRRGVYRALRERTGSGRVIIFVQKIPSTPLTKTFSDELTILLPYN